jgi:hypothetical protein
MAHLSATLRATVGCLSAVLVAAILGPAAVLAAGPAIHVEKLINDLADTETHCVVTDAGSTLSFAFYVLNVGTVALGTIDVTDAPGGPATPVLGSTGFNIGDNNRNALLDAGEIWQFSAETTALMGEHRDVATASGVSGTTTVQDEDAGCYTVPVTAVPTVLTYDGPADSEFSDAATVSATLVETDTSAPVVGASVSFSLSNSETCDGTTDATGLASCSITPSEGAGVYSIAASFDGDATHLASADTADFEVTLEDTALTVSADAFVANGQPTSISATLTDPADASEGEVASPIAGKLVGLTLGSGTTAQSCSAVTDASGVASCSIGVVAQPPGAADVAASFAGDAFYQSASAATTTTVFSALARGVFVVGDGSAVAGTTVTWWSPTWSSVNIVSGGPAPSAFKGFATKVTGATWCAAGGMSGTPPSAVPTYMAVAVVDSVSKDGSTISGTATGIAVVRVNPGYNPTTGVPGTGVVLGFLP